MIKHDDEEYTEIYVELRFIRLRYSQQGNVLLLYIFKSVYGTWLLLLLNLILYVYFIITCVTYLLILHLTIYLDIPANILNHLPTNTLNALAMAVLGLFRA